MQQVDLTNKFQNLNANRLLKWLSWLVAIAVTVLVGSLGFYIIIFGRNGISSTQEHWAQFGDFLGGTVNPLMSFLALIAIVLTIILQSKQLETSEKELALSRQELQATREELAQSRKAAQEQVAHFKSEAKKADVYRTIQVLETRLEGLYRESIYFVSGGILLKRELYFLLTFATSDALKQVIQPETPPPAEFENELVQTKALLMQLHLTIVKLSIQLTLLAQCGNCDSVLVFYEPTINHLASKLKAIGYLPESDEFSLKLNTEMRQKIKGGRNDGI